MQVVSLVITGLTASAVLAQEEAEKNCDFECPTKGRIFSNQEKHLIKLSLDGSFADPCTCRRYYQCVDFRSVREALDLCHKEPAKGKKCP